MVSAENPSPLMGEGLGRGERLRWLSGSRMFTPPQPLPIKGRGFRMAP